MFKYLRMDAYRLIKTKTLYVALGIILAAVAFSVYMMSTAAMPDLSATGATCRSCSFISSLSDPMAKSRRPSRIAGKKAESCASYIETRALGKVILN